MSTSRSLHQAKGWDIFRDLSHHRNPRFQNSKWQATWVFLTAPQVGSLPELKMAASFIIIGGESKQTSSLCPIRALMVSRRAKIPFSIEAGRGSEGTLLTIWDYCFVIIVKSTPGIPVPSWPKSLVELALHHWASPLSPLFLSRPSLGSLRHKDPSSDQEKKKIPFSFSLENLPKGLVFKF